MDYVARAYAWDVRHPDRQRLTRASRLVIWLRVQPVRSVRANPGCSIGSGDGDDLRRLIRSREERD